MNDTCRVDVRKIGQYIEFWVVQNTSTQHQLGHVLYSPRTGHFLDRTTMMGSGEEASRYNQLSLQAEPDGSQNVKLQFGGRWEARDIVTELSWDQKTGHLQSIMSDRLIARASFMNGWHSGPIKERFSKVDCGGLTFFPNVE